MDGVVLRDIEKSDLPVLFEQQLDSDANYMAAFTAEDPTDEQAFMERWHYILSNRMLLKKLILYQGEIAGYLVHFDQFGKPSVGYWLGKPYWGKGIASDALSQFVALIATRPLYARVAIDNIGSRRVLEKCGFELYGEDRGFAHARQQEIDELILILRP